MLPSVCDIPDEIIKTLKKIVSTALSYFFQGLAAIATLLSIIQQVINSLRQLVEYVKAFIEAGARLFIRLLEIANSRSIQEACTKFNALVEDFGDWSGFQNVVDTLKLDCKSIPTFSIDDLCNLLDDVLIDEVDGQKVYRVMPKKSVAAKQVPVATKPSALPSKSTAVSRSSINPTWYRSSHVLF